MKKNVILEVFGYLKDKGIVAGESEFSEFWLGHSEGYMRKLQINPVGTKHGRCCHLCEQITASQPFHPSVASPCPCR
jgi:hypothetical protein